MQRTNETFEQTLHRYDCKVGLNYRAFGKVHISVIPHEIRRIGVVTDEQHGACK